MKILDLYLSFEKESENEIEATGAYTDVVVTVDNNNKYIASFFAYDSIEKLNQKHQKTGEYLYGKYFRVEHMVLVEECTESKIREVVQYLIDEDDFKSVFRLITT